MLSTIVPNRFCDPGGYWMNELMPATSKLVLVRPRFAASRRANVMVW